MKRSKKVKHRMIAPIEVPLKGRGMEPGSRNFLMGRINIIVSQSTYGWHISISHPKRYPTWDEIADARYALIPNEVTMGFILPPKEEYVNLHPNVFHLWEIDTSKQVYATK